MAPKRKVKPLHRRVRKPLAQPTLRHRSKRAYARRDGKAVPRDESAP